MGWYTMLRFLLFPLLAGSLGIGCASARVHGPVCSWHLDPTSTMTIQWLEVLKEEGEPLGIWRQGRAGFGYGDDDDETVLDMQGRVTEVQIRRVFHWDAAEPAELSLRIRYDDGFVAFINGVEVARANVQTGEGGTVQVESHEAEEWEEFALPGAKAALRRGSNVLALQGYNAGIDSSDFTLHPVLRSKSGADIEDLAPEGAAWSYRVGPDPEGEWRTAASVEAAPAREPVRVIPRPFSFRFAAEDSDDWRIALVNTRPFVETGNAIHSVVLTRLQSGTTYRFVLDAPGPGEPWKRREFKFRTAPSVATEEIVFVAGGDMFDGRSKLDRMNARAGAEDPLFALLGGDLAYANDRKAERWYEWLDSWSQKAITPSGNLVPMVIAIGNHEVLDGGSGPAHPRSEAKQFYSLFPLPEDRSNYALDFGSYLSLVLLDSNHTQRPSAQTAWLRETLEARRNRPHLFACYHRPTYGTLVKGDEMEVRKEWVPLFERYGVDAVFENDHHIYKRTLPIRDGKIDPEGVVYLGDGAWGVKVREIPWEKIREARADYIVRAESINHLYRVILRRDRQQFDAMDAEGRIFDSYTRFVDRR